MSHGSTARGRSPGTVFAVVVLVIIGVLAIIAGITYFAVPAKSLPAILGTITHPPSRADAHRPARGIAALVLAAICLVAAWYVWYVSRRGKPRPG